MTRILVSVRSGDEARLAISVGVDLLDVKEPANGPLGAAEVHVVAEVLAVAAGRVEVSVALGELLDFDRLQAQALPGGIGYAKLGLAGCANLDDWRGLWRRAVQTFPASTRPVAVIYADWQKAQTPPPAEIIDFGAAIGCQATLVDTFDKSGGDLFQAWNEGQLAQTEEAVRAHGMLLVLAGSLSPRTVPLALFRRPDYLAFRGAACKNGRHGQLDRACLAQLVSLVRSETNLSRRE